MSTRGRAVSAVGAAGAVGVATALDATLREPPLAVHPVRAVGRYLSAAERFVPSEPRPRAVAAGGLAWTVGAFGAVAAGVAVEQMARRCRPPLRTLGLALALWPLFAHRMLLDEVTAVEDALAVSLHDGRNAVSRLVSRDVSALTEAQVRQAAIESLAENLSDSVTAPLLWFGVGGLPAIAFYRYANTADALWGYRTPRWRHAGTVAARADDVLNFVPARITAAALFVRPASILDLLRDEARRTPSPNAGWPMAALALRLGIRLEKPGVYALAPAGREPTAEDTRHALRLVRKTGFALAAGAAALAAVRAATTPLLSDRCARTDAMAAKNAQRSPGIRGRQWRR